MKLTREELLDLYQPVRTERSECPTPEELTLATTGGMDQSEQERVAVHLTLCSDCAEEFRLVRPLEPWVKEAGSGRAEVPPVAVRRSSQVPGRSRVDEGRRRSFVSNLFQLGPAHVMAAMCLVVSVLLGVWLVSVRRGHQSEVARLNNELAQKDEAMASSNQELEETKRTLQETIRRHQQEGSPDRGKQYEEEIAALRSSIDELSRPQINAPIVSFEPQGSIRGQVENGARSIDLPAGANSYMLVLNVTREQSHSGYELDIEDLSGKVVRRIDGLHKTEHNTFTLGLSRQLLPAGSYRFRLYGIDARQRKLVEDYAVRIRFK